MSTPDGPRGGRDERDRRGLRPATVGWGFLIAAVLGYLVQRYLNDHLGRAPFPSWPGLAILVVLCAVLVAAGWPIRRWRAGRLDRRLDPLLAFRTLILARAGALAGGVVAGWYLAHALVLAPDAESASVQRGVAWCVAYVAAGAALSVAGLVVQGWCRVDPPDDDADE